MTLSALQLLSVLLSPLVLGLAVLSCAGLELRAERALAAALAYVAGCAALAGVTTVWLLCGAPLEGSALPLAVLALAALLFVLGARGRGARAPRPPARRETVLWATVALLALLLLLRDLHAARFPVMWSGGDEGQNWALKGKLLFDVGALGSEYARRLAAFPWSNPDYPLLNPLLQVWTHAHAGAIVHVENRFPIQLASLALLVLLAAALRRYVRPWVAAVLLLILFEAGELATLTTAAGADALVALGLLASCECALRWRRTGEARWFRAAALALTFLVWTKNEGLLYAALLVPLFFLGARRRPTRGELLLLAGPAGVAALGLWLNARFGLRPFVFLESAPEGDPLGRPLALVGGYTLQRVAETLQGAFELLVLQPRWQAGLLLAFLGGCCLAPRSALRGERRPLTLLLCGAMLGLLAVYPRYPFEVPWNLAASFTRVFAQLLPTVVLWLAMSLARLPVVRGWLGRRSEAATACTVELGDART